MDRFYLELNRQLYAQSNGKLSSQLNQSVSDNAIHFQQSSQITVSNTGL